MKPLKSDLSVDAHLSVEQPPSTNAVDPSVQPRERGPRANETSSDSSSAGVAARPALARPPDELNVDELLGALDVLYRASHEHALEGHPWQRPNRARTVIDVWLGASSLEHVKEVLHGGVMEAAARIAGPAPPALARPAWQRLIEMATYWAGEQHHARGGYFSSKLYGQHDPTFGTCNHPDCALIRAAAALPPPPEEADAPK